MIEPFPRLQQPLGSNSCLPTAIRAVLRWHGVTVTQQTVSDLCEETILGCDLERALSNLRQEYDVEYLSEEEALRAAVTDLFDPQPVIVTLKPSIDSVMDHAVVVLGIQQRHEAQGVYESIEFMDPLTGEIESETAGQFWEYWNFAGQRAFLLRP